MRGQGVGASWGDPLPPGGPGLSVPSSLQPPGGAPSSEGGEGAPSPATDEEDVGCSFAYIKGGTRCGSDCNYVQSGSPSEHNLNIMNPFEFTIYIFLLFILFNCTIL